MNYLKNLSKKTWSIIIGIIAVITLVVVSVVTIKTKETETILVQESNPQTLQEQIEEDVKETIVEITENEKLTALEEVLIEEEGEETKTTVFNLTYNRKPNQNNGGSNNGGSNNGGSNNGGSNNGGSNNGGSNNGGSNNGGSNNGGNQVIDSEDIIVKVDGEQSDVIESYENGEITLTVELPEEFNGYFIEDKIDESFIEVAMSSTIVKLVKEDQIYIKSIKYVDKKIIEVTLKTETILESTSFKLVIQPGMISGTNKPVTTPVFKVVKKEEVTLPENPTFTNVSVHDPSVIRVEDTYYVFGSHLGVAKTDDLMNWTLINSGVKDDNSIIPNIYTELKEVFEWAESDTLWASDVIQLKDGRYYMYYNACKGDSPRSATGLAVSDSIEGPYEDLGIFLKSGMWGQASEDGTIYDATKHPNAVDPDVFYDKDGKLWMVYGSYSGGIFILEMDEETGFPVEGQGYGKKLLGGSHLRIEGAYMQYSPETDYYYLILSFGGLDSTGGYNLRVGRSKTPDGEFIDASGKKLSDAKASQNYFDDAAIEPYGNKVMGNFQFTNFYGLEDFKEYGYVSSGHNSTYFNEETGKYFNIFHTRFPNRGEEHEVRVHQMFMNVDDWLVVTPHAYTGETIKSVTKGQVVGAYHYVNHGNDISTTIKNSEYIQLHEDGTISGSVTGTWKIVEDYYAEIKVDDVTYKGVFIKQWDESQLAYVMAFTALSNENTTIWGSQLLAVEDDVIIDNLLNTMEFSRTGRLYENVELPTVENPLISVSWSSSNPSVLSNDGQVTRPNKNESDAKVTLTVTMTKGNLSKSKSFDLTVVAQTENMIDDALTAHYDFSDSLDDATVIGSKIGQEGGEISFVPGIDGNGIYLNGESGVLLPDTLIQSASYTVSMWVKPDVINSFSPAFFAALSDTNWVSLLPQSWDGNTMVWSNNSGSWYDGSANMKISAEKWTHLAFSVNQGELILYIDGIPAFKGQNFPDLFTQSGVFTLGVNYWNAPYQGVIDELRVYETAISPTVIEKLASTTQVDLITGLVANYSFDQNLEDSTSQASAGIVTGNRLNTLSEDTVSYTNGVKGDALIFDGEHGVKLPNSLLSSNTYSVSLWINPDQLTSYTPMFFGAMNSDSWISFHPMFREGDPYVNLWSGTVWYDALTKTKLTENEWVHLAFTVNEGTAKVYINGLESFSGTNFPNIFKEVGAEFGLGVNYWDIPFKGLMDELNIYNLALSPQQIKALAGMSLEEPSEPTVPVMKEFVRYSFDGTLSESQDLLAAGVVTGNHLNTGSDDMLSYTDGINGQALMFDGEHGVKLPNNLIYGNTYSVSLWLNPETLTKNTTTFFGATNPERWISLVPKAWDDYTMLWSGNQWFDGSTKVTLPLGEWSHVVFTINQGVAKVYINGEELFSGVKFPDIFNETNAEFGLGVNYWDTPYKGLIDELSVYNYDLSAEEILTLFNTFKPIESESNTVENPVIEEVTIVDEVEVEVKEEELEIVEEVIEIETNPVIEEFTADVVEE